MPVTHPKHFRIFVEACMFAIQGSTRSFNGTVLPYVVEHMISWQYAIIYADNIFYKICWQYMLKLCKDIVTTPVWPILCAVTKLLARSLHAHTDPCIALSWYGYLMTKRLNMTYEWVELWNFERRYWPGIHKWGVLRLTIFSIPRSKTLFHRKHYV